MKNKIPNVVTEVVNNNLCIGCGMCSALDKEDNIKMTLNEQGFFEARQSFSPSEEAANQALAVCPFSANKNSKDENDERVIASRIFDKENKISKRIGSYKNLYVGHSNTYRLTSSSGGLATYYLDKLFKNHIVDHAVVVSIDDDSGFYSYRVISSLGEITKSSKTRYYPVTLETALKRVLQLDGRVAVVGVACFVKAVRKAQSRTPSLKNKIGFVIGIICGGVKSTFFTEYLMSHQNVNKHEARNPEYRVKDLASDAIDYGFSCTVGEKQTPVLKMLSLGDLWGTGLFKANACDYCQDVTTELADVSLGDAWFEPYKRDGHGTNIIITRTTIAQKLLDEGVTEGSITTEQVGENTIISSQKGSFNHRQNTLKIRVILAKLKGKKVPEINFRYNTYAPDIFLLQLVRRLVRRDSLRLWSKYGRAEKFDQKMSSRKSILTFFTKLVNKRRKILSKIRKVLK